MNIQNIKKQWLVFAAVGFINTLFIQGVAAQVVYPLDTFDTPPSEWTDNATATVNSENFLAPSILGAGDVTNTLSLSGLPSHSSVTVSFELYIMRWWDGNGENGFGPDEWQLTADGGVIFRSNFAFQSLDPTPLTQAYPDEVAPIGVGATNPPRSGNTATDHLGPRSTTYTITRTFPHTGGNIDLGFAKLPAGVPEPAANEGWGIDNVEVSVSGVGPTAGATPVPVLPPFALFALAVITALFGGRYLTKK